MHDTFRIMGQQMGVQINRGILPESIDVYLNYAINEKVRTELMSGVHTAIQETVDTQASTMTTINAFRTLYRNVRIKVDKSHISNKDGELIGPLLETNPSKDLVAGTIEAEFNKRIVYDYVKQNGFYVFNLPINSLAEADKDNTYLINPMMYLSVSIEYDDTLRGNDVSCRIIGADVIGTTLRDFCNGASKASPVVCLIGKNIQQVDEIDENGNKTLPYISEQLELYTNTANADVRYINVKYLSNPATVKFNLDKSKCVNCDLPEFMHYEIVQNAVIKFYQSINGIVGQGGGQRRNGE